MVIQNEVKVGLRGGNATVTISNGLLWAPSVFIYAHVLYIYLFNARLRVVTHRTLNGLAQLVLPGSGFMEDECREGLYM